MILELPKKLAPLIDDQARYKIVYGGRGKGATWGFARALLRLGMAAKERILCTREIQRTIKESVHYALKRQIELLGMDGFYEVKDNSITGVNGTEFIFAGLRDMDAAKLKSLEGVTKVWVAEAHVISDKSWRILIPTIREKESEIWIEFNPELDTDPTYDRFIVQGRPNSIVIPMSFRDNPWFPAVLEEERQTDYENDKTEGKYVYHNTWEGVCLPAVEGAIFANEVAKLFAEKRVRPLEYDSTGLVHVVMDLGWGVMTALLVQRFASTVQIIGYHEFVNKTYDHLTNDPDEGLTKLYNYRWGKVFMPHDASHKDPKTGKSHKQVMENLGWLVQDIPQIGIENYIEKGRGLFNNVYISEGCKDLIQCLRRFKYRIATESGNKTGVEKDDWSHGGETWCYTAVVADELVNDIVMTDDPYKAFASGYAA